MQCSLEIDGFCMLRNIFPQADVDRLIHYLLNWHSFEKHQGGLRNLLDQQEMLDLVGGEKIRVIVEEVLGVHARPVRGILFDKSESANWKVPWHQDVTIAVKEKVDVEGFGPWSTKAGVIHVQPPASVLEKMITVRIHLDDCPETNGALRVIPGSHGQGKLPEREIEKIGIVSKSEAVACEALKGDVLLMRPLLIHSSSASAEPSHRRILHFDFASGELPGGMKWAADQA